MATKGRGERDVADLRQRLLDIEEKLEDVCHRLEDLEERLLKSSTPNDERDRERQQVRYQARISWRHFKEQLLSYL